MPFQLRTTGTVGQHSVGCKFVELPLRISLTATVTSRARRARGDANREAHVVTRHRGHGPVTRGAYFYTRALPRVGSEGPLLFGGDSRRLSKLSSSLPRALSEGREGVAVAMAPPRHNPKRVQRRAQQLQERQREEAERRRSRQGDADKEPAARRSLDKDAPSFGKGDLPQVDLRDDPTTPDGEVTEISCYGGRLQSLSQIVGISRFANLRSLCVHGCRLTRMDVDPMLRACGDSLRDLNLSSNRLARLEGLPVLRNLRTLDVTNNAIVSLDGIDLGAPKLSRLVARYNRVRSLHALTIPRADGQPWSLAHLDIRDNNVETFADLGAGLAAVVSLRAILLRSSPSPFGSFEPSSDADDPSGCPAPPSTTDSLEDPRGFWGGRWDAWRRVGNPVCLEPSYRLAIAALAPWLRELDGEPLSRGPDELAEGSGAVADAGNADLLERAAREAAEAAETSALARSAAEAARVGKEEDPSFAGTLRRRSRPTTRPPRDGIERRRRRWTRR